MYQADANIFLWNRSNKTISTTRDDICPASNELLDLMTSMSSQYQSLSNVYCYSGWSLNGMANAISYLMCTQITYKSSVKHNVA